MAGLDGWRKLAIACALLGGCQRLEYVDDEPDDDDSDGGANAEWNIPPDQHEDGEPLPEPPVGPVCVVEEICECYGPLGHNLCDRVVDEHCAVPQGCDGLEDAALETCVAQQFCGAGGELDHHTLVCNGAVTCAGACDLDPAACDEDGDGAATFACGAQTCGVGQYCVALSGTCDDGGYACMSAPPTCEMGTFADRRTCVGELACEDGVAWSFGHEIVCSTEC